MICLDGPVDSFAILDHLPIALAVVDARSRDVLMLNHKFVELSGYTETQIVNERDWFPLAYPDARYREHVAQEWRRRANSAWNHQCNVEPLESVVTCADGRVCSIRAHLACHHGMNIITLVDITDQKQLQGQLQQLASTDSLTGLSNRRAFFAGMEQILALSSRHLRPVSIMLADIDHFKEVNDTYGHQAGDAVLRHVAQLIRQTLRASDMAARVGGEEFALLLPETGRAGAFSMADRLRRAIAEDICVHGDQPIPITISFGLACLEAHDSGDAPSCDEFLRAADSALYASKRAGRNRVSHQELRIP